MSRLTRLAVALILAAGAVAHPGPDVAALAAEPSTSVYLDSEPGDVLGGGIARFYRSPDFAIQVRYLPASSAIAIEVVTPDVTWNLAFAAPPGSPLVAGTYENARTPGPGTESPGLVVNRNDGAVSCGDERGRFVIHEIVIAPDDSVTAFAATFEHHCNSASNVMFGEARVNSSVDFAAIEVSPTLHHAPAVPVGTSAVLRSSFTNVGTLSVRMDRFLLQGDTSRFAITNDACSFYMVDPGQQCVVDVSFTPDTPSTFSNATLSAADTTARGQRSIELHGGSADGPPGPVVSCEIAAADSSQVFSEVGATVVANELLTVYGWDWPPSSRIELTFIAPTTAEQVFIATSDAIGDWAVGFEFDSGGAGRWSLAAGGSVTQCSDELVIDVAPFTDVLASPFLGDIKWLYVSRITRGCTATLFCPGSVVNRGQMAAFLSRGLDLPLTSNDYFDDDDGTAFEHDINRLAAAGITGGCAPRRFCPSSSVAREQMASFLARALGLPQTSADYFTDDEASRHEADINRLAAAGITGGCAQSRFCPAAQVTRAQMAAFLHRALE